MAQKDYYSILGVDRKASEEDIKKAYKKMCLKYHPDRWANASEQERKDAEEKFKEINEANGVLSDPKKRQNYDLFGNADVNTDDMEGFDPFERLRRTAQRGWDPFGEDPVKGEDLHADVTISMKEAFSGVHKEVKVEKPHPCSHCNGTGSADGKVHDCPHCHGTGTYRQVKRFGNATFESTVTCPYCHGTGKNISDPCPNCHGRGVEYTTESAYVDIPSGIFDGANLVVQGAGCPSDQYGGINGDLIISIHVVPEGGYSRESANLVYSLKVNLIDAWCGCRKTVPCLDGTDVAVRIPPLTESGKRFVVKGKGFIVTTPFGQQRGDFVIKIEYEVPSSPITVEQKKKLEEFYNLEKK